ncbi:techylectin-5B-like [Branchiostoma lanceolatum]|uniref:techylectin-5B-like n=1 Tax=Branchiostoma lanceolatum TaxID=7740 RepID=UPI003454111C
MVRLTLLVCVACVFIRLLTASDVSRRRQQRSLRMSDDEATKHPSKNPPENATSYLYMDIKHIRKGIDALLSWRGTAINYFHHLKTQLHVVVSRVEGALEMMEEKENVIPRRDYLLEIMSEQLLITNDGLNKFEQGLQDVSYSIQELLDQRSKERTEKNLAEAEGSAVVHPKDCQDVVAMHMGNTESGVYIIQPLNYPYSSMHRGMLGQPFYVYCRIENGEGWTVIQRRKDNNTDFYRTWHEYKRGFGSPLGDFWLGNDRIHLLTSQGSYKLRVYMVNWDGESKYADYGWVVLEDEAGLYRLRLGEYGGTAGDSLSYHRGQPFSTWDRDNDARSGNCATICRGAWWYRSCHHSNLNGVYLYSEDNDRDQGIDWNTWTDHVDTLMLVEMRLLPTGLLSNTEKLRKP